MWWDTDSVHVYVFSSFVQSRQKLNKNVNAKS